MNSFLLCNMDNKSNNSNNNSKINKFQIRFDGQNFYEAQNKTLINWKKTIRHSTRLHLQWKFDNCAFEIFCYRKFNKKDIENTFFKFIIDQSFFEHGIYNIDGEYIGFCSGVNSVTSVFYNIYQHNIIILCVIQ